MHKLLLYVFFCFIHEIIHLLYHCHDLFSSCCSLCLILPSFRVSYTQYEHGIHRSDAEALINKVPVIEVAGHVAVCDGGGGALGHPVEFIQLDNVSTEPAICKYCGLRFKMKAGGHHH